jgi:ribonuclease HI
VKYYAVKAGRTPGIYTDWAEAEAQVKGFSGAEFRSFRTREEAEAWLGLAPAPAPTPTLVGLAVDAACSGNPGPLEFRVVSLETREVLVEKAFPAGTNNLGEFLAIVEAAKLILDGRAQEPIYTDSLVAVSWIARRKVRTNLHRTAETEPLFRAIQEAEEWISRNPLPKIRKWDTSELGEIPADYGRK